MELDIRKLDWQKLEVDLLAYVAEIRTNVDNVSDPTVANDLLFLANMIESNTPLAIAAAQEELRSADALEADYVQMKAMVEAKTKQLDELLNTPPVPPVLPPRETLDEPLWSATRDRLLGWVREAPTPTNFHAVNAFKDWAYSSVNLEASTTIADSVNTPSARQRAADSSAINVGADAMPSNAAGWTDWLANSEQKSSKDAAAPGMSESTNAWIKSFRENDSDS